MQIPIPYLVMAVIAAAVIGMWCGAALTEWAIRNCPQDGSRKAVEEDGGAE